MMSSITGREREHQGKHPTWLYYDLLDELWRNDLLRKDSSKVVPSR